MISWKSGGLTFSHVQVTIIGTFPKPKARNPSYFIQVFCHKFWHFVPAPIMLMLKMKGQYIVTNLGKEALILTTTLFLTSSCKKLPDWLAQHSNKSKTRKCTSESEKDLNLTLHRFYLSKTFLTYAIVYKKRNPSKSHIFHEEKIIL